MRRRARREVVELHALGLAVAFHRRRLRVVAVEPRRALEPARALAAQHRAHDLTHEDLAFADRDEIEARAQRLQRLRRRVHTTADMEHALRRSPRAHGAKLLRHLREVRRVERPADEHAATAPLRFVDRRAHRVNAVGKRDRHVRDIGRRLQRAGQHVERELARAAVGPHDGEVAGVRGRGFSGGHRRGP